MFYFPLPLPRWPPSAPPRPYPGFFAFFFAFFSYSCSSCITCALDMAAAKSFGSYYSRFFYFCSFFVLSAAESYCCSTSSIFGAAFLAASFSDYFDSSSFAGTAFLAAGFFSFGFSTRSSKAGAFGPDEAGSAVLFRDCWTSLRCSRLAPPRSPRCPRPRPLPRWPRPRFDLSV